MAETPHPFRLTTTLGADALLFLSLSATEELGRLFSFDVLAPPRGPPVLAAP